MKDKMPSPYVGVRAAQLNRCGILSTTRFFRLALLLPLLVACVMAVAGLPSVLLFGWLPYLVIAVPTYFAVGRAKSLERLVTISMAMPIAMCLMLMPLSPGLGVIGFIIVISLVVIAWLLYGVCRKAGWVLAMPPNTSLERTREG